jgi:myo-inositol-1(or 4)-monophosphatase
MTRINDLTRIHDGLMAAVEAIRPYTPGSVEYTVKSERGDPLTAADEGADVALKNALLREGEGWLSEETADSPDRLDFRRVWVVDPIDGTREFVDGIPEWCISIGLVEDGLPVAGGILNPETNELVIGSLESGVEFNGSPSAVNDRPSLDGAVILASRSESRRGEWDRFRDAPFTVRPCGSVAYKMALVAAGQADGTWTLVPKSEWDVAAGTALIRAAGGDVTHSDGSEPRFNRPTPRFPNLLAASSALLSEFREDWLRPSTRE